MSSEGTIKVVKDGDSAESLAVTHGLFWETVWFHPDNAELRQLRQDQNVLMAGDEIFIPERVPKTENGDADAVHTFERKGVPSELNVQFQDLRGEPYADAPYSLLINGEIIEGALDGDGRLIMPLAPEVRRIHVEVGEEGELVDADLYVGHLDPIDELSGVQARLMNLGFYAVGVDGQASEALNDAIAEFRVAQGLDEAAEEDPEQDTVSEEGEGEGDEDDEDDETAAEASEEESGDAVSVRGNDDDFKQALKEAHGT